MSHKTSNSAPKFALLARASAERICAATAEYLTAVLSEKLRAPAHMKTWQAWLAYKRLWWMRRLLTESARSLTLSFRFSFSFFFCSAPQQNIYSNRSTLFVVICFIIFFSFIRDEFHSMHWVISGKRNKPLSVCTVHVWSNPRKTFNVTAIGLVSTYYKAWIKVEQAENYCIMRPRILVFDRVYSSDPIQPPKRKFGRTQCKEIGWAIAHCPPVCYDQDLLRRYLIG